MSAGSWTLENDTDTRTNGQHYTAEDCRPTNQVKLKFHGTDTDTDVDILADLSADSTDTRAARFSPRGCPLGMRACTRVNVHCTR